MDDIFSKIKRKLIPQTSEVISPAEREQRIRKMLGYDPIEENIDPEFDLSEIEENEESKPIPLPGRSIQNEESKPIPLPGRTKIKKSQTQKALEILNKSKF